VQPFYPEIQRFGAELYAVSFAPASKAAVYLAMNPVEFPVLADPMREAYRALELGHTSWLTILRPRVLGRYLKMVWKGGKLRRPMEGDDMLQLGGDFVLDAERRLVYAYRSADPADRPPPEQLMKALQSLH
jgi:peroxiredoxin